MSEVWTCVDRLSIHYDIHPPRTAASSSSAVAAGAITPAAESTKTVLMPLGPTQVKTVRSDVEPITVRNSQASSEPVPSGGRRVWPRFAGSGASRLDAVTERYGTASVEPRHSACPCCQVVMQGVTGTVTANCDPDIVGALDGRPAAFDESSSGRTGRSRCSYRLSLL